MLPTPHRAGRDDPLVHQHHRLGSTRPEGVDDRLDILLVHDDVVDTDPLGQLVAGDLGVVELDDDGRPLDRLGPGFHRQGLRLLGQLGDLGVAGVLLCREPVDVGLQRRTRSAASAFSRVCPRIRSGRSRRWSVGWCCRRSTRSWRRARRHRLRRAAPRPTTGWGAGSARSGCWSGMAHASQTQRQQAGVFRCRSQGREKRAYTPPPSPTRPRSATPWFVPVMLTLMVLGDLGRHLLHHEPALPIESIGRWNLAVGFGLMMAGFAMTTRWR